MLRLRGNFSRLTVVLIILGLWLFLSTNQAQAVPSFARQTGLECNSCHTMFPELTATGRNFKLNGFTATKHGDKSYEWPPPVSAMVQLSFTHLNKEMPNTQDPSNRANDNVNVPQAISLFYGGRIYGDHVGALVQGTYDGVGNKFFLDLSDIRFTVKPELFGKPLILGLTINNNPTVSDVLNTTPAWGFPAGLPVSGATSLTPTAGLMIENGLASMVGGAGAYFYWNNLIYGEFALYGTARQGVQQFLGAGTQTGTMIQDAAPYWRVFVNQQWGKHSLQVGHFGLISRVISPSPKPAFDDLGNPLGGNPNLLDTHGPIDRFADLGFDAQYQFIGKKHLFTAQTSYIHEDQRLSNAYSQGGSFGNSAYLDKFKINANYYYRTDDWGTIGGTIAYNNLWGSQNFGSTDPTGATPPSGLYGPGAGVGSRVGKPNSDWWVFEVDYMPWWKWNNMGVTKFTLQYTVYSHFNGARSLYDGNAGDPANGIPSDTFPYPRRNASANNTLYLLVWQTF